MSVRVITKLAFAAALLGAAACEFGVQKSANPLSPSIAGPLPGVAIAAPRPIEPINGVEVLTTSLPARLVFDNASSNSPRPFWQIVEVAADAGFSNKLYTSERLTPDSSGRTTHVVPGSLAHDFTYYWRVLAEDGANASDPSTVVHFLVVEPVIIEPPVLVAPVGGATTENRSPDFVVGNGLVSGPAGTVTYKFEVANDLGFTSMAATGSTTRSGGLTTTLNLGQLAENKLLYWRVLGTNGKVTSAYSAIQSFKTPAPAPTPGPYVPPPPSNNRTPDPSPGQTCTDPYGNVQSACLPLPDMGWVVYEVAAQYPGALANSCQESGGSWEFMDRVVDRLRQYDTRWGYNWKRGVVGDPSLDVVDYHFGPGPDEGSPDVWAVDIITGHCGPSPQPGWGNITNFKGSGAKWTGRGRF